jgi:hypothetical protein
MPARQSSLFKILQPGPILCSILSDIAPHITKGLNKICLHIFLWLLIVWKQLWKTNNITLNLTFMGPCVLRIFLYISNKMQRYTVYCTWKLLYMFRVVLPPIIRSAYNCIYSIWYLSHRYCYLPLSWKSWNTWIIFYPEFKFRLGTWYAGKTSILAQNLTAWTYLVLST